MQSARPSIARRSTVFAAVIVIAVLAAWWLQKPGERPKPVQIDKEETLQAAEISFTELIGQPTGAPANFECIQCYDVRPLDPKAAFSKPFKLHFFEGKGQEGLETAQLKEGRWQKLAGIKPPHPDVTASLEATEGGIYALGRFR